MRYTREDYMSGAVNHRMYYGQIAEETNISLPDTLLSQVKTSIDPHLNDIPLATWDRYGHIHAGAISRAMEGRQNGSPSLSDRVCVLKERARQLAAV